MQLDPKPAPGGNPYVSLLRTAWRYAKHQRGRFVFIYALFGLANLLAAFNPLLFGWFVDQVQRACTRAGTCCSSWPSGPATAPPASWSGNWPLP